MINLPGPRTSPTIKPLAIMNSRNMRSWDLRLGPIQIVILLGLVLGSMLCTYLLGMYTGHRTGFEAASEKNLKESPKQPVFETEAADVEGAAVKGPDLFAKLRQQEEPPQTDTAAPRLGVIEESEPVATPAAKTTSAAKSDLMEDDFAVQRGASKAPTAAATVEGHGVIRVLGEGRAQESDSAKTLGALLREKEQQAKQQAQATPELPVVKATPIKAPAHPMETERRGERAVVTISETRKPEPAPTAAPAVKKTPAAAPESFLRAALARGWYAQIAAPKALADANELGRKLKAAGFAVGVEKAVVRGENYYRIVVGPEDSREQAERLIAQLKRENIFRGDPFLRMVK